MQLPQSARHLIETGAHAHLVTLNEDGSAQVTLVWAGLEGDDIVTAHLFETHKVRNLQRDSRVTLSFESPSRSDMGLLEYLVVYGRATIEQGGAPQLLQRLARVYLGPEAIFPTMPDPPPGFVNRVTVDRISGVGPWTGRAV